MKCVSKTIEIPAKTYILGEYVALTGGPALLITHEPKFRCIYPGSTPILELFHPDSPAGMLIKKYNKEKLSIDWYDPFNGTGGMGGSGAEFIVSYLLITNKELHEIDPWHLKELYHEILRDLKLSIMPSGYDLIAQCQLGITYIEANAKILKPIIWPFSNAKLKVHKTKLKTKTHEHLAQNNLPDAAAINKLTQITNSGFNALLENKLLEFCAAIKQYHTLLNEHHLVHQEIPAILKNFYENSEVIAAKGCGAFCSDAVILCTYTK